MHACLRGACMQIYIHTCLCMYVCVPVYMHGLHVCDCVYACAYVCVCECVHVCMYDFVDAHLCLRTYVRILDYLDKNIVL